MAQDKTFVERVTLIDMHMMPMERISIYGREVVEVTFVATGKALVYIEDGRTIYTMNWTDAERVRKMIEPAPINARLLR